MAATLQASNESLGRCQRGQASRARMLARARSAARMEMMRALRDPAPGTLARWLAGTTVGSSAGSVGSPSSIAAATESSVPHSAR